MVMRTCTQQETLGLPDRSKFAEKIKELFCSDVVAIQDAFVSCAILAEMTWR